MLRTLLSLALGGIFILAGAAKLTPAIDADTHAEITQHFPDYLRVMPFREHVMAQYPLSAAEFMLGVGYAEVVCGALMILGPMRSLANFVLLCIMGGATYIHMELKEDDKVTVTAVLAGLLILRQLMGEPAAKKTKKTE